MARRLQSAPRPLPLRLRLFAAFCVLLVFGAGAAQAAHRHGVWVPHGDAHAGAFSGSQLQSPEDNCQLCQAMHSALPVGSGGSVVVRPVLTAGVAFGLDRLPDCSVQFAMFGRPPPAASALPLS